MPQFTAAFSYYGSKSKLAHRYPEPHGRSIIEPFAGSAAYSLRHGEGRDVVINDLDPDTYAIWCFLTRPYALEWVKDYVPETVKAGDSITEMLRGKYLPRGLELLMRAEAHMGTAGTDARYDIITSLSATCWNRRLLRRLEWVIPRVRHWHVTNLDYRVLPTGDDDCTWFVDPPYANAAGRHYRQHSIDYEELATWCQSRRGQVIVCENEGATWLPFEVIAEKRVGFNTVHRRTSIREAAWVRQASSPCLSPSAGEP